MSTHTGTDATFEFLPECPGCRQGMECPEHGPTLELQCRELLESFHLEAARAFRGITAELRPDRRESHRYTPAKKVI